jgi:hypothetical protein
MLIGRRPCRFGSHGRQAPQRRKLTLIRPALRSFWLCKRHWISITQTTNPRSTSQTIPVPHPRSDGCKDFERKCTPIAASPLGTIWLSVMDTQSSMSMLANAWKLSPPIIAPICFTSYFGTTGSRQGTCPHSRVLLLMSLRLGKSPNQLPKLLPLPLPLLPPQSRARSSRAPTNQLLHSTTIFIS